jgi:hypothetical protein
MLVCISIIVIGIYDVTISIHKSVRGKRPSPIKNNRPFPRRSHNRHPEWIAAIPPDRFRTFTRASPASRIMPASFS